ncbi:MAG: cytochrome c biogenesis protein CcsA [Anaerolineae bacterium]|nr:MAG: cytochrome c biogenesis protein CcsA [Anaerolineae bacterium]
MTSGPAGTLAAGACFLLAALAHARRWEIGSWLGAAGTAVLAGALAARGLRAGHWPLASEYEVALAFALGTALARLALSAGRDWPEPMEGDHTVQAVTAALAAALVACARFGLPAFKRAIQPLPPALDSAWFPLHVGAAALGYGALAMAGAAGLVWLVREAARPGAERLMDRAVSAGYPLLTLSMLLGIVWAQAAWGRYWSWDLKEIWTLVTWLTYTLYWHLRRRPGWRGRRLAWLALAGLGAVLFSFLGVGWLARAVGLESLHLF